MPRARLLLPLLVAGAVGIAAQASADDQPPVTASQCLPLLPCVTPQPSPTPTPTPTPTPDPGAPNDPGPGSATGQDELGGEDRYGGEGASTDPSDPQPWGTVDTARTHRRSTVRRRGIRVRVSGQQAGRARAVATLDGRVVAKGSKAVPAGTRATFAARLTPAGRRLVARGQTLLLSLAVRLPAESDPHVKAVRVRGA